MRRMGLRANYQKQHNTVLGAPSEGFPCVVDISRVTAVDQVRGTDINYISLQKGLPLRGGDRGSPTPGMFSAGSCQTALTQSSVWTLWRWRWKAAASQRSSTPTKSVSSPLVTSWPGCDLRRSRSAGLEGSAAKATSWSRGCGAPSST
jgi:hypothetical protein